MIFSSVLFLYLFLPITLLVYYLIGRRYRNNLLLLVSLVFFAWGGVSLTIILLASITLNYFFGRQIEKHIDTKKAYWILFAGVAINLATLVVFKYSNFIIENINGLSSLFKLKPIPETKIILPVGISFYTFHLLSYLVDIYRRKTLAQRNIFDLALYVAMFSQLIAGPIIRYSDVWQQLKNRIHTNRKFSSGIEKFLIGLAKKVLLANTFSRVADDIFGASALDLSAPLAWLGIGCYTLQIYYDFSGYSDMAIGLGRMFGFEFLENFNYPYIAKSVKDFWRRWHISLSTFFRDYVYIPLGGNKVKVSRNYLNLILVFFLTGFWHGASWSFVIWGLFHGFFMVIEKLGFDKILEKTYKPIANLYTILVVMFGWVLFRSETLEYAISFWKAMFEFHSTIQQKELFMGYMGTEFYIALAVALLGAFGFFGFVQKIVQPYLHSKKVGWKIITYTYHTGSAIFYSLVLFVCTLYLIAGTYNPFIYYRF